MMGARKMMAREMMRYYRPISLAGALGFAATGLLFLLRPDQAIAYFNRQGGLARMLGLPVTELPLAGLSGTSLPLSGLNFYVVLAAGYMYLVTQLAVEMFIHPRERVYPLLLAHAKLGSAALSLYFFLARLPALIFLANGVVDGAIGLVALYFYREMRKPGL